MKVLKRIAGKLGPAILLVIVVLKLTDIVLSTEAQELLSDEALAHLKTYKYSSVDKSLVSKYILRHYVRFSLDIQWDTRALMNLNGSGMASSNSYHCGWRQTWSPCSVSSSSSSM